MDTLIYLRRSVVDEANPGTVSYEQQLARCQDLARSHGADAPDVLVDWGRSGGEGLEHRRSAYQDLRERVAGGRVRWIVSYDLSRLSRSTRETLDLVDLATTHGAKVHVGDLGILDPSDPTGRFTLTALSGANTLLRDMASKRAKEIVMNRKAQGLQVGRPPFGALPGEDVATVLAAFDRAGSYHQAARQLNGAGIPTRAGSRWYGTGVRRVVLHARGSSITARPRIRSKATHITSGLLRCACGGPLSVTAAATVQASCSRGIADPAHPRPIYVTETLLLPWIKAEAARLELPEEIEIEVAADEHRRAELEQRREKVIDLFIDGTIRSKPARDRRLADIDAELATLEVRAETITVPELDWTWSPSAINAVLRRIFRSIQLGPDQRPVSARWLVPEWRRAD